MGSLAGAAHLLKSNAAHLLKSNAAHMLQSNAAARVDVKPAIGLQPVVQCGQYLPAASISPLACNVGFAVFQASFGLSM